MCNPSWCVHVIKVETEDYYCPLLLSIIIFPEVLARGFQALSPFVETLSVGFLFIWKKIHTALEGGTFDARGPFYEPTHTISYFRPHPLCYILRTTLPLVLSLVQRQGL